jgi:hypothetical protein
LLTHFLNDSEIVPVAPIITGITLVFTFHMRCISIVRSLLLLLYGLLDYHSGAAGHSCPLLMPSCRMIYRITANLRRVLFTQFSEPKITVRLKFEGIFVSLRFPYKKNRWCYGLRGVFASKNCQFTEGICESRKTDVAGQMYWCQPIQWGRWNGDDIIGDNSESSYEDISNSEYYSDFRRNMGEAFCLNKERVMWRNL